MNQLLLLVLLLFVYFVDINRKLLDGGEVLSETELDFFNCVVLHQIYIDFS